MNTIDLLSYAGLVGAIVGILQILKGALPKLVAGREKLWVLVLAVVLGVVTKLTIPGSFPNIPWVSFVVMLFVLVAPNANKVHDDVLNPIAAKMGSGSESNKPPSA